ncbi:hypothetical protein LTR66_011458 [Elasticomyces elasticus]|nr:hypothetical protein LTR66_011458 [Elasticomyces elasticus]KAK4989344.1 hypothetical protein LTR50_003338 [Elasticomyces elasticus]
MAKKALKSQAARNTSILNRSLLISAGIHTLYHLLRLLLSPQRSLYRYIPLSLPSFLIQFWFERVGRPRYGPTGEAQKAGEDLEAKGLTEWMWDVVYWSWGCIGGAAVLGDWVWWFYVVIPLYSAWLAWTTFAGAKRGMAGMTGGADEGGAPGQAGSKRQQKMEKRGAQKVQYRQ